MMLQKRKEKHGKFLSSNYLHFYTDKLLKTKNDPLNKSILQNIPARYIIQCYISFNSYCFFTYVYFIAETQAIIPCHQIA